MLPNRETESNERRDMKLFLGYATALSYWRAAKDRQLARPTQSFPLNEPCPQSKELDAINFYRLGIPSGHLDVIVGADNSRKKTQGVTTYWERKPTKDTKRHPWYYRVDEGVYVAGPELCFLQLARTYSLAELVRLGFELCGGYSIEGRVERGFSDRSPLTTKEKLTSFLETASGHAGMRAARKAAQYVLDNSASPRETDLAMMLCMPVHYGGYGLRGAELNAEIDPSNSLRNSTRLLADRRTYKPDIFWRKQRVIVEYDSNYAHALTRKITLDSSRRNSLQSMGYSVVTVSNDLIRSTAAMDRVVRGLCKALKKQVTWDTIDGFGARQDWQRKVLRKDDRYWKDAEPAPLFED